jgi:hypothetical protein
MAISTSMTKRTRASKLAAKGASLALQIAREKDDPKYSKYKRFKTAYMKLKKDLVLKYFGKAKAKMGVGFEISRYKQ